MTVDSKKIIFSMVNVGKKYAQKQYSKIYLSLIFTEQK